jgi:choline-phosphate cytidylyltransferase
MASKEAFNPAALTTDDIQDFVAKAIEGEPDRKYKINPPPVGRPVRIYADGTSLLSLSFLSAFFPTLSLRH